MTREFCEAVAAILTRLGLSPTVAMTVDYDVALDSDLKVAVVPSGQRVEAIARDALTETIMVDVVFQARSVDAFEFLDLVRSTAVVLARERVEGYAPASVDTELYNEETLEESFVLTGAIRVEYGAASQ